MKRNGTVAKIELFSPGYKIQINPKVCYFWLYITSKGYFNFRPPILCEHLSVQKRLGVLLE